MPAKEPETIKYELQFEIAYQLGDTMMLDQDFPTSHTMRFCLVVDDKIASAPDGELTPDLKAQLEEDQQRRLSRFISDSAGHVNRALATPSKLTVIKNGNVVDVLGRCSVCKDLDRRRNWPGLLQGLEQQGSDLRRLHQAVAPQAQLRKERELIGGNACRQGRRQRWHDEPKQ